MLQNPKNYTQYTLFWSGPFSNWARTPITIDGVTYNCVEQYMMVKKALTFGDTETASRIMEADHPRDQKALGRQVKDFDMNIWGAVARDIVQRGNYAKYTQNAEMFEKLMETSGTLIVEASPLDKVWGIGLGEREAAITPIDQWPGNNWLGQVLTEIRDNFETSFDSQLSPPSIPLALNHD